MTNPYHLSRPLCHQNIPPSYQPKLPRPYYPGMRLLSSPPVSPGLLPRRPPPRVSSSPLGPPLLALQHSAKGGSSVIILKRNRLARRAALVGGGGLAVAKSKADKQALA